MERWRFLAEEFNSARRSVLVEHERKVHKASWRVVELKTYTKFVVLTCILLWMETCKIVLTQCLMIALSSKMCHPSYYSPSLLGACFLEVSGGSLWRSYGVRVKPMSWWLRHACRSTENLEKRLLGYCSSWTTWPRSWVLQRAAVVPRVSTTLVARSVSSLLPRSPSLSADGWRLRLIDEPSRSKRYRPRTHSDVEKCGTSATGLTPDSEMCTVLSTEATRVAGEEAQSRKLARRRRRTCTAPPPRRVVFPRAEPSRRNHGSVLRSHAQRVSDLLKNEKGRVGVVGKAGRDGGGKLQAGSGKWLDDNKREFVKWNQNVSNLPRPVQTLQGFRRLALGTSRDPLPQVAAAAATMEVAMVVNDEKACCPIHNVLEAQ